MTTPDRTRRPVTAAVAALGLVVASALVALLVAGLFEGLAGAPGWLPETAAVLVFLGGLAVTGQVMVDVAGPHAIRSAIGVVVAVGLVGYMASRVTEAHGEGLEPTTLLIFVGGLGVLLISSILAAHRR